MITVCTHIVISSFDLYAETAEQFSRINSWVISVGDTLGEANIFAGSERTWSQSPEYPSLTLLLSWLRVYVISISYRISESDTLTTVVLAQDVCDFNFLQNIRVWHYHHVAQPVRDFDFLQNIRVWHSHHGCPGSGCTWFRFPKEYSSLTLSPRLSWLSLYAYRNFKFWSLRWDCRAIFQGEFVGDFNWWYLGREIGRASCRERV